MTDTQRNKPDFTAATDVDVDVDALFDVLSNPRRRFVLAYLDESSNPLPLRDIAYQLATWEYDEEVPSDDVKSIYVSLFHVHIPKMAEVGLIEYSEERDAVTLVEDCDAITSLTGFASVESPSPP